MSKGEGIFRDTGRQTPASGAHIFLGQPNVFFVTVNAKDAVPWMANATVQESLSDIWRTEATAWLVGYYLNCIDTLQGDQAGRPVEEVIEEACRYAHTHFELEEALMARHGYPQLEAHRQEHETYKCRVQQIRESQGDNSPFELFLFLKDWWLNHITEKDQDYAPFLGGLGKKSTGSP